MHGAARIFCFDPDVRSEKFRFDSLVQTENQIVSASASRARVPSILVRTDTSSLRSFPLSVAQSIIFYRHAHRIGTTTGHRSDDIDVRLMTTLPPELDANRSRRLLAF